MPITRTVCPNCGKLIIPPMGNLHSPILLVGDIPGKMETKQGRPFAFREKPTQVFSGDVLRDELLRVGFRLEHVLATNLWQHIQAFKEEISYTKKGTEKKKKVEACPATWHLDQLVNLMMMNRSHILLMGSKVTQALIQVNAEDVSGTRVKIPFLKTAHVWVSPNPSSLFGQPIGEFRLALERFSKDIE